MRLEIRSAEDSLRKAVVDRTALETDIRLPLSKLQAAVPEPRKVGVKSQKAGSSVPRQPAKASCRESRLPGLGLERRKSVQHKKQDIVSTGDFVRWGVRR